MRCHVYSLFFNMLKVIQALVHWCISFGLAKLFIRHLITLLSTHQHRNAGQYSTLSCTATHFPKSRRVALFCSLFHQIGWLNIAYCMKAHQTVKCSELIWKETRYRVVTYKLIAPSTNQHTQSVSPPSLSRSWLDGQKPRASAEINVGLGGSVPQSRLKI